MKTFTFVSPKIETNFIDGTFCDASFGMSGPEILKDFGWEYYSYWDTFLNLNKNDGNGTTKVEEGDVVLDIGANLGLTAIDFINRGAKKVYCVEPDPILLLALQENLKDYSDKTVICNFALGPSKDLLKLRHWDPFSNVEYWTVCVTLNDILNTVGTNIDYLKMDIEGAERSLLVGYDIRIFSRIHKMYIEWHRLPLESPEHYKQSIIDICQFLNKSGFNTIVGEEPVISTIVCKNINFSKE